MFFRSAWSRAMVGRPWPVAIAAPLLVGVPLILCWLAVPRLLAGFAVAPAQPVLVQRLYMHNLSKSVLEGAQERLGGALPTDGESRLWRAELAAVAAPNDLQNLRRVRQWTIEGLQNDPSSPRGWTLLCELDVRLRRPDAGACMDTAFYIGPFDWFVARRRSELAVLLWPQLDSDTKQAAARRMRLIWENPRMRDIVYDVDQEPFGDVLLTKSFLNDKDELRAVNRWLINMRLWGIWRDKVGGPP